MSSLVILLLTLGFFSTADSMGSSLRCLEVQQANGVAWKDRNKNATISCQVSSTCSKNKPDILWFVFKKSSWYTINIDPQSLKYGLDQDSLVIRSLSKNDNGIYHCAAVVNESPSLRAQQAIGNGTVLVVRGQGMQLVWHILLWLLFALLLIYSLTVLVLVICKRTGLNLCLGRATWTTARENKSTKSVQFSAVVQELYSRRNLKSNSYHGSSEIKAYGSQYNHPDDDVYQNL